MSLNVLENGFDLAFVLEMSWNSSLSDLTKISFQIPYWADIVRLSFVLIPFSEKVLSVVLAISEPENWKFSPTMVEDCETVLSFEDFFSYN